MSLMIEFENGSDRDTLMGVKGQRYLHWHWSNFHMYDTSMT